MFSVADSFRIPIYIKVHLGHFGFMVQDYLVDQVRVRTGVGSA